MSINSTLDNSINTTNQDEIQKAKRATCPNCNSDDYFCIRSKDGSYSFVLGVSSPEDETGRIIPYLPVRVLTCGRCQRITLEVETGE